MFAQSAPIRLYTDDPIYLPDAIFDRLSASIDKHGVGANDRFQTRFAGEYKRVPCCIVGHYEDAILGGPQEPDPLTGDIAGYAWGRQFARRDRGLHSQNDAAFDEAYGERAYRMRMAAVPYFAMMNIHPERDRVASV